MGTSTFIAPSEPAFVLLRNKDRYRPFLATLYHAIVCKGSVCICGKIERMEPDKKGEYVRAEQSVYLPPKATNAKLPAAALRVPQIKAAIAEGMLEELTRRAPIMVVPVKEKR